MARYTPEFLAALRQRYEETDQPMRPLALEFGIGISTLSAIVEREGWVKRSQRRRGHVEAPLLSQAQALMASLPPRSGAPQSGLARSALVSEVTPSPTLGGTPAAAPSANLTAAERLEALLLKEIEAEEAAREALGKEPRLRAEADACTRRLATMTQTLQTLQKIREANPTTNLCPRCAENGPPMDIDELRLKLAERIEAFMQSREDWEFEPYLSEAEARLAKAES